MRIPKDSFLLTLPIAHRGLHDAASGIPENSLAAFRRAAEEGYAAELDVHFSADGKIVVFHDDNLLRMTGVDAPVSSLTAAELSRLRLSGTDERIPLLTEVIELLDGKTPLLVEIKDQHGRKGLVQATAALMQNYRGEYALQSFHPLYVAEMKRCAPHVPRGQLGCGYEHFSIRRFIVKNMHLNFLTKPDFISYNADDLPFSRARRKDAALLAWTVRSEEEYARLANIADNVIFEKFRPPKKRPQS